MIFFSSIPQLLAALLLQAFAEGSTVRAATVADVKATHSALASHLARMGAGRLTILPECVESTRPCALGNIDTSSDLKAVVREALSKHNWVRVVDSEQQSLDCSETRGGCTLRDGARSLVRLGPVIFETDDSVPTARFILKVISLAPNSGITTTVREIALEAATEANDAGGVSTGLLVRHAGVLASRPWNVVSDQVILQQ